MVRVAEYLLADIDGSFPVHVLLVDHDAQKLGNGEGGVGVVDLDADLVRKVVERAVAPFMLADDVLDGGAGEEIVLL
ncbi:hypothetical protein SDC9_200741 [bioreactor metagenome]|uniref:Uncharacterized protein n=1 Tax=bioreactor metagenome TaxID=1076179 RepID=A0A645IP20_9ZZZZ